MEMLYYCCQSNDNCQGGAADTDWGAPASVCCARVEESVDLQQCRSLVKAHEAEELTEGNAVGRGFAVDPEGDPREHIDEDARGVHLDDKVAHATTQVKGHQESGERP